MILFSTAFSLGVILLTLQVLPQSKGDPAVEASPIPAAVLGYAPDCALADTFCVARPAGRLSLTLPSGIASDADAAIIKSYEAQLPLLFGLPLEGLPLQGCLVGQRNAAISSALPFAVDSHPHARHTVAKTTLARLQRHMGEFARAHMTGEVPKMVVVQQLLADPSVPNTEAAHRALKDMQVRSVL